MAAIAKAFACMAAVALLLAVAVEGAVISHMYPVYGSVKGGTRLTIQGSGFARAGVQGTTVVFVGSQVCKQIEYYSSDVQVTLQASMAEERASVRVTSAHVMFGATLCCRLCA